MRIAIAGYGLEGKASLEYWNTDGNEVVVADERNAPKDLPPQVKTIVGPGAFMQLADYGLIIRSPSINPNKLPYDHKVWSATNEFFAKCPAPIIGVTGTKGKGTTSSLIASILKAAGKNVHLVGNIGTPALAELPKIQPSDIVVFELSSFQLWDLQRSPHIAVVLGIEPDHLDVHDDMQDYVNAKSNIRRFQTVTDVCLYHPTNKLSAKIASTPLENQDVDEYGGSIELAHMYGVPSDNQVYVEDGFFCVQERRICSTEHLKLPGAHNLENACASISAVMELWLDIPDEIFAEGLAAFEGLPHRLKFVREVNGISFYDDSIATSPGSVIAAIHAFRAPKVLLLGGSDKGANYTELIELCEQTGTKIVAVGQTGSTIAELSTQIGTICVRGGDTMTEIVKQANELAQPGDVVILSPASASFDMFKSYSDRGDQFIAAVNAL